MTHDLEALCGSCGHRRGLHAVTDSVAKRVGCIATKRGGMTVAGCGCERRQDDPAFTDPYPDLSEAFEP